MLLAQTASLPQPVPPHKEKEGDGGRKRLSELLEIPQASVFNGKAAQALQYIFEASRERREAWEAKGRAASKK